MPEEASKEMKLWHLEDTHETYHHENFITSAETQEQAWEKIKAFIQAKWGFQGDQWDSEAEGAKRIAHVMEHLSLGMVKEVPDGVLNLSQSFD
jgi:hypothetical protein